ncbi:MAG: DUF58 domain-containing protein [Elusimicrobia bacterium CG06_land_8_20_14_3_00_38_11]|nr:MAG: DUF58 domain-containing protein [Elusimicrobia bacterium CG06_land_8_20_14_3_00_38_11]
MKSYLDPLTIAKISTMSLKAKYVVEGFISGLHTSKFKGHSLEFAQHREYSFGDELKHLDWKVFGKSDKFFVKQYEEETNLKAYIMLDASGSMGYKSVGISKLEYGSYIAAALSYLMIKQGDAVGLVVYDTEIKKNIPPRATLNHLSIIFDELSKTTAGGETDISKILYDFSKKLKKRTLIILISDLFDEQEKIIRAVKNYRFAKNEIIVFHIMDKIEENLDMNGNVFFKSMENEKFLITETDIIKKEYQKIILEFIEKYKSEFRRADIDYSYFNTSSPLDLSLTNYLSKREKLQV